MSYDISIGEMPTGDYMHAKTITIKESPHDGSPTDGTNQRWPSYSGWANFIRDAHLDDVMNELMPSHPGIAPITLEHKKKIDLAYLRKNELREGNIGRMEWLKFWIDWALANCKNPAFCNS